MSVAINKSELHGLLVKILREKTDLVKGSIAELKASAAEDTKSSAGDKYETSREMIRQEIDKAERMEREYAMQQEILKSIHPEEQHQKIMQGSLVGTDRMLMYIAVSLGKIKFNGQEVFVVSAQAPLARLLMGKSQGDQIDFNGVKCHISSVC